MPKENPDKNAFGIHNNDNGRTMNWDNAFVEENNTKNNGLLWEIVHQDNAMRVCFK
jgi:hypothetical protein